jgi:uncharacterized protein
MRRTQWLMMGLVLVLSGRVAVAELKVPRHTGWVVDQAQLFSSSEEQQLTAALQRLKATKSGAQMAVLTVPALKGDSLELFSVRVVEAWKLGKKDIDNGLLLLIVRDDRKIRIEVGYGLEGRLNDARCGDIIRGMGPFFRERRFADGAMSAIGEVQQHLTGTRPAGLPARPARSQSRRGNSPGFMLLLILFFVLPAIMRGRYGRGHTIFIGGGGFRGGGGGGFSGGGFSGGGGSFGGGGASGSW